MNEHIPRMRIRWSDIEHYSPIEVRITDWNNLKRAFGNHYMLVDSIMEYNGNMIELCVPYYKFVQKLRSLEIRLQQLVIKNKAIITLMKTSKWDRQGMVLKVREWERKQDGGSSNLNQEKC